MEHHFNTNIAKKYGIEEAILLHHFYYWIAKNAANAKHFYDGLYWTYNSREAYAKFFGYINEAKIYRIIKKFVEEGLIAKGDYNTDKWKHTNWYALTIKGLEYLRENGYDMTPFGCVLQNADFDCCKMNNGLLQNEQSLYNDNIITDNNSTNNKEEEKELKEKFATFVSLYKQAGGKVRGVDTEFNDFSKRHKDWQSVVPYLELALQREIKERNQAKIERRFFPEIKMLKTYLGKQRAWEMYVTIGEKIDNEIYNPQGRSIWFDENTKTYWSDDNFYYGVIFDGYTDDNRPDGATITLNNARGRIQWNAKSKEWRKII